MFSNDADTGVNGGFLLHTCSHDGGIRQHQRHSLTLHVGTHQGTVRIIILQERNHRCCHREYHSRRNVHQIHFSFIELGSLFTVTAGYRVVYKVSVLINRLVGLCYSIVIFFIGRQIDNLIRYPRIFRVGFIQLTIWGFNKSILVNPCIGCQRVNQADIRTFRCLDRTHSSIMGIVNVSNLKTGSVSGQTAWSQCGETTFMRQLGQRVILVHKLGQLRTSEEFFNCRCHRFNINQRLWRNALQVLSCHSLANHTFHTGKADTVLVLQKFTNGTDTAIAQMVNIVIISNTIFQVNIIVNGSKNIFLCNVHRHQFA